MTHNDRPFEVNEKVKIVRARHGWYDGRVEATIIDRWQNVQNTWRYIAKDQEGQIYEIEHTRDARR